MENRMKEKKKSTVGWIMTWAGQKKSAYVWSVWLAIGNVVFKIIPYFIIADVVKMFLDEERDLQAYVIRGCMDCRVIYFSGIVPLAIDNLLTSGDIYGIVEYQKVVL